MEQIIRGAEIRVPVSAKNERDLTAEKIELDRIVNPRIGKDITPEFIAELHVFMDEFSVSVNVLTDVDLPPSIREINMKFNESIN